MAADRRVMAGVMASSVAHDANNLLTTALLELEMLALSQPHDESIKRVHTSCREMAQLITNLRDFGKEQLGQQPQSRDLAALVNESLALTRRHTSLKQRQLNVDIPPTLQVRVLPDLFNRMLTNLVLNAAEATPPGGLIHVSAESEGERVFLRVDDNGPGIPERDREAIFEAFYTTKPEGTGLGLISVKAAAMLHGGTVSVATAPEGGARFEVRLPEIH
ncbi:MAG: PAS domain-containing sensor histidine kinase [Candidatus Methylacidiphilales bacterium]